MDSAPFRKQFQYQSPAITAGLLPPHAAMNQGWGRVFRLLLALTGTLFFY